MQRSGKQFLFDLGELGPVSKRDLNRIDHIFVSHMHMDHFMGFDLFMRSHIPHRRIVNLYGPVGIVNRCSIGLSPIPGIWIENDQLMYQIFELGASGYKSYFLSKGTEFALEERQLPLEFDENRIQWAC